MSFVKRLTCLVGQKIVVVGHVRPDGDCIGSQVALTRVLRSLNLEAYMLIGDAVPRILEPFVGDTPRLSLDEVRSPAPVLISVDCADKNRMGSAIVPLLAEKKPYMLIDHHRSTRPYAEHNYIQVDAAATAEVLAKLFLENNLLIDPTTAQALYVGLLTDTGQFKHGSTTPHTLRVAASLIESGASPDEAAYQLYEQETMPRLALLQTFLATLKLELDGALCVGTLSPANYAATRTIPEDAEGFVDYTRAIRGVKIGAFLEEQDQGFKGSLRTRDESLRLDLLAAKLGGGGHSCAAGFRISEPLAQFYPRLVEIIDSHLQEKVGQ